MDSTDRLGELDGIPVRFWDGVTERGTRVLIAVHRVMVQDCDDLEELSAELEACDPPADLKTFKYSGPQFWLGRRAWDGTREDGR
jgi:hypothetical protein